MKISAKQQAENMLISSNPRYQIFVAPVKAKTLVPGVCSPAERFLPEPEGSLDKMGADDSCPKDSTSSYIKAPYDYNRTVTYITERYGRVYSWGSATQLPALQASEWFRDQGHDVFMVWKPQLWHINQSRRERWGRDMDNYGYGYPPEAASDTWEVLVAMNNTGTPKIRAYQPQGNMTQVMTLESRYPEEALGGTMYGAPYYTRAGQGNWNTTIANVNTARPNFAAPLPTPAQRPRKPGFWKRMYHRLVKKKSPQPYYTRAGQGNWNQTVANVTSPRPVFASPQVFGPSTRAQWTPPNLSVRGTQVKFATNQLSTGQVIPAPHVMTPVYPHVGAPIKWVQNSMFTPKGTLESMESVFR